MRLLYRADGGHPIGTGHTYRAIRLLNRLSEMADIQATLVAGDTPAARAMTESVRAKVVYVPPSFGPESVKPRFEFASLASVLAARPYDAVVIDMLDTSASEMSALKRAVPRVASFDDRGDGRMQADALINVLVTEPYPETLPAELRLYQGPKYAALDSVYADARGAYRFHGGRLERVFVSLGGGDAAGLTVKVARALGRVPGVRRVEFGVGPAFPHQRDLENVLASAPFESEVFVSLPNLLERYLGCDLAIIAGGLTMYEACCIGAPALAVCQSIDHQFELAARLAAEGAMATAGYGEAASESKIAQAITRLASDEALRKAMSESGPRLVDGKGTERVAGLLKELGRADG